MPKLCTNCICYVIPRRPRRWGAPRARWRGCPSSCAPEARGFRWRSRTLGWPVSASWPHRHVPVKRARLAAEQPWHSYQTRFFPILDIFVRFYHKHVWFFTNLWKMNLTQFLKTFVSLYYRIFQVLLKNWLKMFFKNTSPTKICWLEITKMYK
jgi:hypothetical protein